jgi:hypothetical protein
LITLEEYLAPPSNENANTAAGNRETYHIMAALQGVYHIRCARLGLENWLIRGDNRLRWTIMAPSFGWENEDLLLKTS